MGGLYDTATLLARLKTRKSFFQQAEGLVAQWIRHRPTEPGIAGSSPAKVIFPFGDEEKEKEMFDSRQ